MADILAVSEHIVRHWTKPCPMCGAIEKWLLNPTVIGLPVIGSDDVLSAFLVGCRACGFLAFLYPPIADPEGWRDAEQSVRQTK